VDGTVHTVNGFGGVDGLTTGEQFQEAGQELEPQAELFEEFALNLSYIGFSVIDAHPQASIYLNLDMCILQLPQRKHIASGLKFSEDELGLFALFSIIPHNS
jgi:hypothetical protein